MRTHPKPWRVDHDTAIVLDADGVIVCDCGFARRGETAAESMHYGLEIAREIVDAVNAQSEAAQ